MPDCMFRNAIFDLPSDAGGSLGTEPRQKQDPTAWRLDIRIVVLTLLDRVIGKGEKGWPALWVLFACSTSRRRSPARIARGCWPISAPRWSRSRLRKGT